MGRTRTRTLAIWLVVGWAVSLQIMIGWMVANHSSEEPPPPPNRCGERPPL